MDYIYIKRTEDHIGFYRKWKDCSGEIHETITAANIVNTKYEKVDTPDNNNRGISNMRTIIEEDIFSIKRYDYIEFFKIAKEFIDQIKITPFLVYNTISNNWTSHSDYYNAISYIEEKMEKLEEETKDLKIDYTKIDYTNIERNRLTEIHLIPDWNEVRNEYIYIIDFSDREEYNKLFLE